MACNGHNPPDSCNGHVNSCPSHNGYVGPRTITFTNITVDAGEIIDLEDELTQLREELNIERDRRFLSYPLIPNLDQPVDSPEVRAIRDLYVSITGNPAVYPISDTEIDTGVIIKPLTIENMKDGIITDSINCICDCNYACTCNCNYTCTCNCNYACTCNCNYACTCNTEITIPPYCTCDCAYCTCDCAYCTCDCNYCVCDCNYACTCNTEITPCPCDCNYCVCDCNYCVCDCNYCICDCNYCVCNCNYCICDCNYCTCNIVCTCDCNHDCTCNCNYSSTYSDEILKRDIRSL